MDSVNVIKKEAVAGIMNRQLPLFYEKMGDEIFRHAVYCVFTFSSSSFRLVSICAKY
jgi:hypothetical protein